MENADNKGEPPEKKQKLSFGDAISKIDTYIAQMKLNERSLVPILNEELQKNMTYVEVYIAHVKDKKDLSKVIQVLNEKLPLKELQHLKRVRQKAVILCPVIDVGKDLTMQNFVNKNISELTDVFEFFSIHRVAAKAPKLKSQYTECNRNWPCNFHPDKYLERCFSGNFFVKNDMVNHKHFMEIVFEVCKWYLQPMNAGQRNLYDISVITNNINGDSIDIEVSFEESFEDISCINAAVVVNPLDNSIVAISFDNRKNHPLQHAAMLAVDNVAKTQKGGVWGKRQKEDANDAIRAGIDDDLLKHLKAKFRQQYFGASGTILKFTDDGNEFKSIKKEGPYLCTGYTVYLLREPCVMCSMALVHARAKRIFFCFENSELGAVKSKTTLQGIASLNHHFEVFTGFL